MDTLVVLSIIISIALGCFAIGYGVFVTGAEVVKQTKSSDAPET